jgi:hypothetical protein
MLEMPTRSKSDFLRQRRPSREQKAVDEHQRARDAELVAVQRLAALWVACISAVVTYAVSVRSLPTSTAGLCPSFH